jgi:predicted transcriptional regulator
MLRCDRPSSGEYMTQEIWRTPVREFMSRGLVSARPETLLADVQRAFGHNDISAVPVIDEEGVLHGILSSKDLLRFAREQAPSSGEGGAEVAAQRAADAMRATVLTIDEGASVASAAQEMVRHRVHRLIVVREGRPCAVISTRDAMRAIALARSSVPLGDVMTREVLCIDVGMPADEACARLDDANVRGLIVVDGSWPVGVFTHIEAWRTLALATQPAGGGSHELRARVFPRFDAALQGGRPSPGAPGASRPRGGRAQNARDRSRVRPPASNVESKLAPKSRPAGVSMGSTSQPRAFGSLTERPASVPPTR